MKKKIIVDAGGKPNYPDKTIPALDIAINENVNDQDLPAPPPDISETDGLCMQVQGLSMEPITVTIPGPVDIDTNMQGDTAHANSMGAAQPFADNVRNSFTFVPDGANEETVKFGLVVFISYVCL